MEIEYHYHFTSMLHEAERYLKKQEALGFKGGIKKMRADLYQVITWLNKTINGST